MRKTALTLLLALSAFGSQAQFNIAAAGPEFEEPEDKGFCKIINEKNGYAAYLYIQNRGDIDVRIYDEKHTQVSMKTLEPEYGKLKAADVEGVYEINGNIVLFISEVDDKIPVLYRLTLDGKTGRKLEEKTIGELKKMNMGQGYAMAFGHVPPPGFYVKKDPNSDNYAVAAFNSFASNRNERILITHYDGNNKEISKSFYQSPNDEYKYLKYLDMTVLGNKSVRVLAVGQNTQSSGGDQNGSLLFGTLNAGDTKFELAKIKYPNAGKIEAGLVRLNPANNSLVMLSLKNERNTRRGTEFIAYKTVIGLDDNSLQTDIIDPSEVNNIAKSHYGRKNGFNAIPQNLFINADGSYTVIYEEVERETSNHFTPSAFGGTSMHTTTKYFLGDLGIVYYTPDGQEKSTSYIPKNQQLWYTYHVDLMYHSDRIEKAQKIDRGNQFKSFAYFNSKKQDYVFINDIAKNQDRIDDKKNVTTIQGLGDCEAFCFKVGGGNGMPKREYVFPEGKKSERDMALFTVADYDREKDMFTTLELVNDHGKKVRLVWLQPQ
ncbi:hypothetical protein ACTHGU_00515 [Chitinophagaceae bacterium MMS25-I14]